MNSTLTDALCSAMDKRGETYNKAQIEDSISSWAKLKFDYEVPIGTVDFIKMCEFRSMKYELDK